jgi:hypothetical protein
MVRLGGRMAPGSEHTAPLDSLRAGSGAPGIAEGGMTSWNNDPTPAKTRLESTPRTKSCPWGPRNPPHERRPVRGDPGIHPTNEDLFVGTPEWGTVLF